MDWSKVRLPGVDSSMVALVTGGTGAIGRECAAALALAGAKVAVIGRSEDGVQDALTELSERAPGGSVIGVVADVTSRASMDAAVERVHEAFGPINALVTSAAVSGTARDIEDVTDDEIDSVLTTNVRGVLTSIASCIADMRASGDGRIVNIASVAGYKARPGNLIYGPSKAAIHRLTLQLAVDLGPSGVRVNCISPGQTPTRMRTWTEASTVETARTPMPARTADKVPVGRRGELADYAGAILFLLSDLAAYVSGTDIPVEGGILSTFP